jgi:hypothetical protein
MTIIVQIVIVLVLAVGYNIAQDVFLIKSARHSDLKYAQDATIQLWAFIFAISDAAFLTLVTGGILLFNWYLEPFRSFSAGGAIAATIITTAIESFFIFFPQWIQFFGAYEYAQYLMEVNQ